MTDSPPNERREASALDEFGAVMKREGRELAGEARSTAYRVARDQRDTLAGYISAVAQAALRGADELEGSGFSRSAASVKRTASEIGGLADRLQGREPDDLWLDVEDFARDHPGLTFGAGFLVAFGVMRFLRSAPETEEAATEMAGSGSVAGTAAAGGGMPPAGS